jgi:hypothetical protein
MEGQKNDKDKLPIFTVLCLQFPNALKEVVKCSQAGHKQYPMDTDWQNFRRVDLSEKPFRYLEASFRHIFESGGELVFDEDMREHGDVLHLAQSIWNQLAHLERKLKDNTE